MKNNLLWWIPYLGPKKPKRTLRRTRKWLDVKLTHFRCLFVRSIIEFYYYAGICAFPKLTLFDDDTRTLARLFFTYSKDREAQTSISQMVWKRPQPNPCHKDDIVSVNTTFSFKTTFFQVLLFKFAARFHDQSIQ